VSPRVAIVDPYSSGAFLARAFATRGRDCVAVWSSPDAPPLFRRSSDAGHFARIVPYTASIETLVRALRRQAVDLVLAGSEPGVELADELAERMGIAANGTRLSEARRDKFLMARAVKARGLATAQQRRSDKVDALLRWRRSSGLAWPVIVKPARSCASDGVALCSSDDEVRAAFAAIMGRPDVLGQRNDAVLLQEFLAGVEYVVDTVSHAGRHQPAAFWRYRRPKGAAARVFYDAIELIAHEGRRAEALFAAACGVLDALEIAYGPAHGEFIWVPGRGPVLVEVAARLNGGNNPLLSRFCGGTSAVDLVTESLVDPMRFAARKRASRNLSRRAVNRFLVPPPGHRVRDGPALSALRRLPSCRWMSVRPARAPSAGSGVVGVVTLIHRERRVIESDLAHIRKLEQNGLYHFAPANDEEASTSQQEGDAAP
jgi:biotin carboxylase